MSTVPRAHDLLVNTDLGDVKQPDWMVRVKEDYFKADESMFKSRELGELLDEMDAQGVERAVVLTNLAKPSKRAIGFVDAHPERFSLGIGGHDFLHPMPNLRNLESFVRDHQVAYTVFGPSFWGDGMYPASDAVYFPLYTKCCEWELPVCTNTGLPGPPIPGEAQNPIHLDRVCVRFPELKLCMVHGADPWWDTAIRLMIKYANLRLMTSAWSPRHLPASLLHFMSTRGKNRIMFASDSPVLSITRCVKEAAALELSPEVLDNYLYGNAQDFFFGGTVMTTEDERVRVVLEKDAEAHVARITIDNPERKNAWDPEMRRQMGAFLDEVATDDDIKVVILRGAGGVFSTGADMNNAYNWYGPGDSKRRPSQRRRLGVDRQTFSFYHEYLSCPKVTIAQVEAYALGGAFELALMSDLAVVGRDAQLGMPGARLLGPALGNLHLFFHRLGPVLARRLLLTGDMVAAGDVEHLGLFTEVCEAACVADRTESWAAKVARMPADGLAIAKTGFNLVEQSQAYVGEEATGFLMHAFATNLRFEPDEFNFVKARAQHGTREAFRLRDEHFSVDEHD